MRRLMLAAVVAAAMACPEPALLADQEPQPARTAFSSRSDLVVLHVSVIDRRSGPVSGLQRDAFTVYEDGRPQPIAFFDPEDSPATVGLVIDSSLSMMRKREPVIAAGLAFAESTNPRDELFTVHFNERVWFGLPSETAFTSDDAALRMALQKSTARGRSAVFDAVIQALEHVRRGSAQKKALIVISDGGDNASRHTLPDLLHAAKRSEAMVYTVILTDEYDAEADPQAMEELTRVSGGISFRPRKLDEVGPILRRIARDLHSGYTIGYVPSSDGGHFRAVRVDVAARDRNLVVRSRSGYATN